MIPPGTSSEPGRWITDRVPFMADPMSAVSDPSVETIILQCSSQIGKSELILNTLCYYIDQRPTSILFVQPTIEAAESFSKERIEPSLMACPRLKAKFDTGKDGRGSSRKSSETIRLKKFPGGFLALVGANSPAGLASRPIQVLLCDEVDRFQNTKEGDPLKLAIQRTANFFNRKILLVSTPTTKQNSHIFEFFEKSDQNEYFVPCPKCGEAFVWQWHLVEWDKDASQVAQPSTARIVCPFCSAVVRGAGKPDLAIISSGEWRPNNSKADKKIKGYHLSALYSPWVDLSDLVAQYVEAKRTKKGIQEFYNLKLGQVFLSEYYSTEWKDIQQRSEFYGKNLPARILLLTAGVDVQRNRLEVVVLGWGAGCECWAVQYVKFMGDPKQPDVWEALDVFLQQEWTTEDGRSVGIRCTCVDSGDGTTTQEVYYFTAQREARFIFAIKGRGENGLDFIQKPTRSNRFNALLFGLGVNAGKSLLHTRLATGEVGPGFVHFPLEKEYGFGESYFRGLYAERVATKKVGGRTVTYWQQIRERNEGLDCTVYAMAALEIFNPPLDELEAMRTGAALKGSDVSYNQSRRKVYSRGVEI